MKRKDIFLYPDHLKLGESFTPVEGFLYYGDAFFNYMVRHDLFRKYYHDKDDYQMLTTWANSYFELYGTCSVTDLWNRVAMNYSPLSQTTLLSLDSVIVNSGYADVLDDAWINMKLANDYFESGDTSRAFERVKRIKVLFINSPYDAVKGPYLNMMLTIAQQLAMLEKRDEAMNIAGQFSNIKNRTLAYSKLATFSKMGGSDSESKIYQDTALADLKRIKFFRFNSGWWGVDYRKGLVEMLTLQDNENSNRQVRDLIRNMDSNSKIEGLLARVRTLTGMNKYFKARSSIPEFVNPEEKLQCITAILYGEVLKQADNSENTWTKFDRDLLGWINYTDFIYDLFEY